MLRFRCRLPCLSLLAPVVWLAACSPPAPPPEDGAAFVVSYVLADGSTLDSNQLAQYASYDKEGGSTYQDGQYQACADAYGKAAAVYDGNAGLHYNRACCLALAGKLDEGLEVLAHAIELGFTNRQHMERDTDLDAFRGLDRFAALLDRADAVAAEMEARSAGDGSDPAEGDVSKTPVFADLDAIEDFFADAGKDLRRVLGARDKPLVLQRLARTEMAALSSWAADHPADAARAELRRLEVHGGMKPPSPSFSAAVDQFLARHDGTPEAGGAALLRQRLALDPEVLDDPEAEGHAEAVATMAAISRQLLETWPDAENDDARFWVLQDAMQRFEHALAIEQLRALEDQVPADDPFWDHHAYELFGVKLVASGLPDFEVTSIDGETLSPAAFRGKVTLLDFWAVWCGPCLAEMPTLQALYAEHHDDGFEIVGISADPEAQRDLEDFRAWLEAEDVPWPQYYDGKGWANQLNTLFGVSAIPTNVLLERDGTIAAVNLHGKALVAKVEELMQASR